MPERIAYKKLSKYPLIEVERTMYTDLRLWFMRNNLSLLTPPLFDTFVIRYPSWCCDYVPQSDVPWLISRGFSRASEQPLHCPRVNFGMPQKREPHEWIVLETITDILVRYDESKTCYDATMYEDGKVSCEIHVDYNNLYRDGDADERDYEYGLTICTSDPSVTPDSMRPAVKDAITSIAAVQSYIMYHKPAEADAPPITRIVQTPATAPRSKNHKKSNDITIKSERRRVITIREGDELPQRNYNYRKKVWAVRGHYARRGADKHLTYIAPFVCRRGGDKNKKVKSRKYIIKK